MRWLPVFLSTLLAASGGLAARKATAADRFDEFHAKSLASTPVKIDDAAYRKLTGSSRNYTAAVLLTALDARYGCQLCREFEPEWDLLARSWTKGDKAGESRVIFSVLDFNDGRDTFTALGLQTAPVLLLFQPSAGPHAVSAAEPLRYDFTSGPQTAEQVHSWLIRQLPDRPHPPVKRPINWLAWISSITILLGGVTAVSAAWPYLLPVIQSRNVWAAVCLISILLFISGHMFNHIRKVPYVGGGGGAMTYFAGGFSNQFGLETQIVGAMYGVLSFATIALVIKVPRMSNPGAQQMAVFIWGGVMLVMYSFLLSVFRIKNGGYPFSLPPFM